MKGNLFESILNSILNESADEAIVNPNDTSKDIFTYKIDDLSNDKSNPDPVALIYTGLDADDIAKIKSNPETSGFVNRKNNIKPVVIHPETLENPNSNPEEYDLLKNLCQLVTSLGRYGNINPDEVLDGAKFAYGQESMKDTKQIEKDENALWDEFLENLDTPRVQLLLASIEKFAGLDKGDGVDWKFSRNNLMKILSQDNKRIAAGKQPATFVAKPQDWRLFNRQIKKDAIPFWLIYKKDPGTDELDRDILAATMQKNGISNATRDNALNIQKKMQGDYKTLGPSRSNKYATLNTMNRDTGYGWGSYYDVSDTEVIPGLEDKFTKEDRQGFLDNIRMIPTDTSSDKFKELNGEEGEFEQTKQELNSLLGVNEGSEEYIEYINRVYAALYVLTKNITVYPSVNWDELLNNQSTIDKQKGIFNMIVEVGKGFFYGDIAKEESVLAKAKAVACLYVCSHRIAPVYGMSQYNLFKSNADFIDNAKEPTPLRPKGRQVMYDYKNIYKKVCEKIDLYMGYVKDFADRATRQAQQSQQTQAATGTSLEESVSKEAMMWADVFNQFDSILQNMGIDKDGNDIEDLGIDSETQQLNEAKFYRILNKISRM